MLTQVTQFYKNSISEKILDVSMTNQFYIEKFRKKKKKKGYKEREIKSEIKLSSKKGNDDENHMWGCEQR